MLGGEINRDKDGVRCEEESVEEAKKKKEGEREREVKWMLGNVRK